MRAIRFFFYAGLIFSIGGCVEQSARRDHSGTTQRITQADDKAVDKLYAVLDKAGTRYAAALDLKRDGDLERANNEVTLVLDDLQAAAAQCINLSGCEVQRFFSTFDHLLRIDNKTLVDATEAATSASDNPEATVPPDEASPVASVLPEAGRTATLLNGRQLSELIALNAPVKAGIEEWLTQLRPNLMLAYENYQFMRYRMWPEYQKAGLPEAVLFGMLAKESGGKVHAVSRSGASGPLQFMYTTGLRFGLSSVNGFDQRFDPGLSARANAAYLNEQLKVFNNNLELVLAAYNGGEGRIQRVAARVPHSSFWDPKLYFELPEETRDYVPKVLAAAWLFLHPERYHLEFPKFDVKAGTITLKAPTSLAELSICLGNEGGNPNGWFRTLRNLNPAFDPQHQQPEGTQLEVPASLLAVYEKSCVNSPWRTLASDLHAAVQPTAMIAARPVRPRPASRTYVVKEGETLAGIARKLRCVSSQQLAGTNHIKPPHYAIRKGQALQVPACNN